LFTGCLLNYKKKFGLIIVLIYLIAVGLALLYFIKFREEDVLSGIFLMLLTTPWSYITAIVLMLISSGDSISTTMKLFFMILYTIINALIIYLIVVRKAKKDGKADTSAAL
jgi:hypothetical protein